MSEQEHICPERRCGSCGLASCPACSQQRAGARCFCGLVLYRIDDEGEPFGMVRCWRRDAS